MAGRIPQPFIDDLLDRLDIVEVIDRRLKLKKTGKNYSARCPFHDEKTPSFSVNPDKQFYYCFGCGAGGNAIGFVMEYDNVDFPQAIDTLAGTMGLEVPREQADGRSAAAQPHNRNPLYQLLKEVSHHYQQQLRQHPQAHRVINYLKARGLSGKIARDFGIGFAPPGRHNLLQHFGRDESARRQLMEAGMLVENDAGHIYDRFRDRVMFPIQDQRGRVIAFGGRVLPDEKAPERKQGAKYLNSPETAVFHKGRELYGLYQLRQHKRSLERVVVVEGYMDVIALAQFDINYATATLGTATSERHLERIFRLCPEVVFCFDGDNAGRKAAFRALEAALPTLEDGRQARFLFLPEGQDPDTMVRRTGSDGFEHLLNQAQTLENFLFASLSDGLDTNSLDGRARLSKRVLPYIHKLPAGIYQQLMFQELARRSGLELDSLMRLAVPPPPSAAERKTEYIEQRASAPAETSRQPSAPTIASMPRQRPRQRLAVGYANLSQAAMALLLHKPSVAAGVDITSLNGLEGNDAALLRQLLELLHRRPESSTAMLLGHWYGSPEGDLLNHLAGQERLIPTHGIERQFTDTLLTLRQLPQQTALADQINKLREANYAEMNPQQKQHLRQQLSDLLQQKQQHDADRKRRGS